MKLNKKHFNLFKKEFMYWFNKFHLEPTTVVFNFKVGSKNFINASNQYSYDNSLATIYLYPDYELLTNEDINTSLKTSAKHEAIHILIGQLSNMARWRFLDQDRFDHAEEELVRRLEKII